MGSISKIQPSFSSGELSPFLYSRIDLARYQTGLKTLKNFFVHPHGGVSNRPGTKFVSEVKDSSAITRIIKFIFSTTQSYVLEFGNEYIRFYKDHAQIAKTTADSWLTATDYVVGDYVEESSTIYCCIVEHTSDVFAADLIVGNWVEKTIYEVVSPYAAADVFGLRFERSADTMYIFHEDYPTYTLARLADDDWVLEEYISDDGPFMPENINTAVTLSCAANTIGSYDVLASGGDVFDPGHVGALFRITHYVPSQLVTASFTGASSSSSISCFTTWRITSRGTWTGSINIEKSTDGGSTWTALRNFSSVDDFNIDTYGTEDVELNPDPFLIRVTATSLSSGTCNLSLTADPFYQNGVVRIATVANATAATATVITAPASTAAVNTWAEGAWSDKRGFPSIGAFHQDRLCLAASIDEPMNIWMSQIANYKSFRVNSNVLATDAINVRLLARQLNAVNGLASVGDLLALTSGSEWRIGADKTVLSPDTVFAKTQGYRGSSGVAPVVVGNQIIYVQANGSVIRNFGYDYSIDSYTGVDLRILSEHLFSKYNIIDMDYQQDTDSLVWLVRDDGKLLSLTYLQEQDVIAWSWHETEGIVESICVIPADGYDELWLLVNRDGDRFIEYMVQRMESEDVQDQFFVDCGLTYDNPVQITNAANTDPVLITAVGHGLVDGDIVDITDVGGMTEINNRRFLVIRADDDTFELYDEESSTTVKRITEEGDLRITEGGAFRIIEDYKDLTVDGTNYGVYTSGGYFRKVFTTFSGYSHLEGRTVAILGNGQVFPQQVVTGGEITLTSACSRVQVGLPYTSDFETLNIEVGLKSGTNQGKQVKISNVTFRLLNSRGGWIGPSFDKLKEGFVPDRESLGTPPLLYSGDKRQALGASFEVGGRIALRQYDPLPISITAVIPEVTVY